MQNIDGSEGNTPLRVAHVVFDLDRGGLERFVVEICRGLPREVAESRVLVLSGRLGQEAQSLLRAGVRVDVARQLSAVSMLYPRSVVAWLREFRPDVVHAHSGAWFKAAWAARLAGVPAVVFTEHGRQHDRSTVKRLLDTLAARMTSGIVAVSPQVVEGLAADVGIAPSRIDVIGNGVDTTRFRPAADRDAVRREFGLAADALVVAGVGRFEHVKGPDVLLDAWELVLAGSATATSPQLLLVGEGSMRAQLGARVAASPTLRASVRILPWQPDPARLLQAVDVFAMGSRSEGTSIALLEAMASGCCPVVTDVGGNAAVLGERLRHRLVAPESPEALAAGLSTVLEDTDARRRDAALARARVEAEFGLDAMVARYVSVYRRVRAS